MNPLVRALGKVLRLVGVSSPEDTQANTKSTAGLPSWRKTAKPESAANQNQEK